jgi:hypothetical protein
MNNRIRELAEQAGIDFFSSTDPEFFGRVYCEAWTEQQQKFAELIVRECAHLVGGYTKENEFGTDVKEAYEEITKHFGVES